MTERRDDLHQTRLFVIRLWPEHFDQGRRVWRGEVVDIAADTHRYFAQWEDLLSFLCEAVGVVRDENGASEIMTEVMDSEPDHERNERTE